MSDNGNGSSNTKAEPKVRSLWTVLVAMLALAAVIIAGLVVWLYFVFGQNARLEREKREAEAKQQMNAINQKKASEDAKVTVARTKQEEVMAQARAATNILMQLLADVRALNADAEAFKSNEAGKLAGGYPDLVAQARQFYERDLPGVATVDLVTSKLENVRRILLQVAEAAGTTYEPDADMRVTAQNSALWAEPERQKAAQVKSVLASLVRESKVKVGGAGVTAASPTLAEAIRQLNEAETAARQKLIVEKTTQEKARGDVAVANAAGQLEAEKSNERVAKLSAERDALKAQIERERKERQAQVELDNSKSRVVVLETLDEATRVRLRKRATEPDVQATLAPFISPGLWTPTTRAGPYRLIEKRPMSLSEIQATGALNPDSKGLESLIRIACHSKNDRPHWGDIARDATGARTALRDPRKVALVAERQKIFLEVAPVLVELKMLDP